MSDNIWLTLIVNKQLFYSPQRSSGNVLGYSFGRITWNLPRLTLTERFLFVNLQKEWVRKRLCQQFMFAHKLALLTLSLTSARLYRPIHIVPNLFQISSQKLKSYVPLSLSNPLCIAVWKKLGSCCIFSWNQHLIMRRWKINSKNNIADSLNSNSLTSDLTLLAS